MSNPILCRIGYIERRILHLSSLCLQSELWKQLKQLKLLPRPRSRYSFSGQVFIFYFRPGFFFCWDCKIYIFSYSKRLLVVSPETHLKVVRRLGNCTIVVFIVCKTHRGVRLGSRRESGYNKSSCFICNSPEMCKNKNNTKESKLNSGLATDNEPPGGETHCISPL